MADQSLDQAAIERYEQETAGSSISIRSLDDIRRISNIFVQSGMFKGDKHLDAQTRMYQAGVKIIAGVEFGIQPFAAMRGINIINGNAEMSANLMAAKVKSHPKYDYKVKQWDNDGCVILFYEIPRPGAPRDEWYELGESSFNGDDAKQAKLNGDNWQKFARNMYFARAMSNGVRIHCPDIFYGAPVYVEGEISAEVTPEASQPAPEPLEAELVRDVVDEEPQDEAETVVVDDSGEVAADIEDAAETSEPVKPGSLATRKQIKDIHDALSPTSRSLRPA